MKSIASYSSLNQHTKVSAASMEEICRLKALIAVKSQSRVNHNYSFRLTNQVN
jgi:hypothetical protein